LLNSFVDADACPVKEEVYRVAKRYKLNVTLVAGSWMRIPEGINAARNLLSELRESGEITGGPPPSGKRDRSRFLQALDKAVNEIRRRQT
jgi:uncharacterized protein YaiI (UPF0178 family)